VNQRNRKKGIFRLFRFEANSKNLKQNKCEMKRRKTKNVKQNNAEKPIWNQRAKFEASNFFILLKRKNLFFVLKLKM
jgi:hypothetical protein